MPMHRKEYYLVAQALAKCKSLGQDNLFYVADMLATDFAEKDPTFKRELFMNVSGANSVKEIRYKIVDEDSEKFGKVGIYDHTETLGSGLNMYYIWIDKELLRFLAFQIDSVEEKSA